MARETQKAGADFARETYDAMAGVYDDFTAHHRQEEWLGNLIAALQETGLQGDRLLDVACGTGKSFIPMLESGWQVTACDISPSMLERAREKVGDAVELSIADMTHLPVFGEFDLVWALDDAVNYLLSLDELERTLSGMTANMAPSGLLLFDVNALKAYRTYFAQTDVVEQGGRRLEWHGRASSDTPPGSICEARLETDAGDSMIHRQRHFSEDEILVALDGAGLEPVSVLGLFTDGVLRQPLVETEHNKAVYIARRKTATG